MRRFKVTVTTASDGTATAYSPRLSGELDSIQYIKTDFANGVDFTITDEATGESLWTGTDVNASTVVRPRAPVHDQVGAARLFASGGTAVASKIAMASTRIKIVIAQGGNAKSGTFHFLVG